MIFFHAGDTVDTFYGDGENDTPIDNTDFPFTIFTGFCVAPAWNETMKCKIIFSEYRLTGQYLVLSAYQYIFIYVIK